MDLQNQIKQLAEQLLKRGWKLVTAESCTGGGVAAALTGLAGSSAWLEGGFVTYSNGMKMRLLGISEQLLSSHGAVSQACVEAMARGALANSEAQLSVALSGIAGPDGGSDDKPVGTVWIGWAISNGQVDSRCFQFDGDRQSIRDQAVEQAVLGLLERVQK